MRGLGQGRAAEEAPLTAQRPLSISPALRRTSAGAPSSNGKTTDSASVNRGSNPRGASISSSEHLASNARRACANAKLLRRARAARRRLPHTCALGRAGADLRRSNGLAAGLFRFLSAACDGFRYADARDLRRRAGAARARNPLAPAAHRERPPADPRRLRRSGDPQDPRRLLARRNVKRRARRLPAPPLERPLA